MLVLARKVGEAIVIQTNEGDMKLTVLTVGEKRVNIGVEGPRSINVVRDEMLQHEIDSPK